ncbi:dynein regulatory complex subunit 7-like [Venturia canescens]|uniref:dynein regulatory complex subunit 7-like n=1 Tax=Venturia canescens TaxID=32260 RepID=UPI001C9C72F8|nr:dynein regulatory complex subunit 7-like [Venturia canescens]
MDILDEEIFDDEGLENESKESVTHHENEENEEDYGEHQEDPTDSIPADIDEETLKQMERDFCLIRLSWPEIDLGDTWAAQLPPSYRTVSGKEKNLLYHAENFRKQYHTIYPDRKPLLLAVDNECGVQKFVSTSIRPSTLLYPELYTWQGCANFVSDHLEYEPPERPLNMEYK